ncbi:Uma2 family endonuclease [Cohnella sp. LGH]|uniref:Uma2 family endonuclease n=1 Tax=Cohnella sp. LGH TaxID=1619153 RepID=UPI001ADB20C7|nr:Uma2 family endonuclease [Cohnella sp. LGH]QTH41094.1 Uma2 family endonuclease [Cohnella sp. LGH]
MKKKTYEELVKESPVTYEMYANMEDDGNRYEISDGVLELMSPSPTPLHQLLSGQIMLKLNASCRNEFIIVTAPLDVILSDTEVRQPDLMMTHLSRTHIISNRGINGAPDLVVEITSKHSLKRDKLTKRNVYAKYGVREYWIVDPSNFTLEQYELLDDYYELVDVYSGEETIRSRTAPCVSFSMDELVSSLPVPLDQLR